MHKLISVKLVEELLEKCKSAYIPVVVRKRNEKILHNKGNEKILHNS